MQAVVYYLALPWLYGLSVLPFPVLFVLSDGLYYLLYYVLGYRKTVVRGNLARSFPEKPAAERRKIERQFYRSLCDIVVENLKGLTMSKKTAVHRCQFTPESVQLVRQYAKRGRPVIYAMAHQVNWEYSGAAVGPESDFEWYSLYRRISNPYFERLFYRKRSRMGLHMIDSETGVRKLMALRNERAALVFVADQTPGKRSAFWMEFLNQPTPVFQGTERIAKKLNCPVHYACLYRLKRGHYRIAVEPITDSPRELPEGRVLEEFMGRLERDIRRRPSEWLWSHRRWKHQPPEDYTGAHKTRVTPPEQLQQATETSA